MPVFVSVANIHFLFHFCRWTRSTCTKFINITCTLMWCDSKQGKVAWKGRYKMLTRCCLLYSTPLCSVLHHFKCAYFNFKRWGWLRRFCLLIRSSCITNSKERNNTDSGAQSVTLWLWNFCCRFLVRADNTTPEKGWGGHRRGTRFMGQWGPLIRWRQDRVPPMCWERLRARGGTMITVCITNS